MTEDVFDTATLQSRVLAAWAASPARFREDANAEEDLALGGYRDRVIVELAQNAADAAARAGVPGRLRLTLRQGVLVAANRGAPLDAAGVESLCTLRASAKRGSDGGSSTVGRFGVGFAAVLAVTDAPAVISRSGGVRWSLADARALVEQLPSLEEELVRRGGAVPVLRLPFPAEGGPPEGYDTAVILPLRDGAAEELARHLLAEVDDALLLALPGLAEVAVDVDGRTRVLSASRTGPEVLVTDDGTTTRWRLASASGDADPWLLADRPTEERVRTAWSVTWAVPLDGRGVPAPLPPSIPAVVHAPTPTDEPLGLPALLLATFPLDPTRRHVAPGPLRSFLVEQAGRTYADLLTELPPDPGILTLVPAPVGQGALDAEIRRAVVARLPQTPFLAAAEDPSFRLRPGDAVVVERAHEALVDVLAQAVPGLLPAGWDRYRAGLTVAGVRRLPFAEVVDLLASVERPPSWWRELYRAVAAALDGGGYVDRDALAGLPVPLVDGRQVRGPRGTLLPGDGLDPEPLRTLGLRVVHPDAADSLLERLGALRATPDSVLADPAVRAAVAASDEADDPDAVADAVLSLVAAARLAPGSAPWLAGLVLPDADGEYAPAGELMLPGSPIAAVVDDTELGVVAPELVGRWGEDVLAAVGVLRTFGLVRATDVLLDPESCDHDLDGEDDWVRETLAALPGSDMPHLLPELVAVRDLDLVAPVAWPRALRLLATPPLREAVTEPARVLLPGGQVAHVLSYTSWWLRRHPVLDGRTPAGLRAPGADPLLHGLYDEVATDLDPELLRGLGVRTTLAALLADPGGPQELLDRLADAGRPVDREQLRSVYTALAGADPELVSPPERLRALVGPPGDERLEVVDARSVVVADAPALLPLLGERARLVVPPAAAPGLADLLELPVASEIVTGVVTGEGAPRPVPAEVRDVLPEAPEQYLEHDELVVDGVELDWWYDSASGAVLAATIDGLGRGLAWAAGRWERRFEVTALLVEPDRRGELRGEREFEA